MTTRHDEELKETGTALVSGLIANPGLVASAMHILRDPKVLRNPPLEAVLHAVLRLTEAGEPVNLPRVIGELERTSQLVVAGGVDGVHAIEEYEPYALNIENHARRLRLLSVEFQKSALHSRLANDPNDLDAEISLKDIDAEFAGLRGVRHENPGSGFFARILTPDEFERDEPPSEFVETLIYSASLHNLVGGSKVGKSFLAMQLAMCIGTGTRFLGLAVKGARVLYVSLEMSAAMVRERMRAISKDTGIPFPVIGEDVTVVAPTGRNASPQIDLRTDAGRAGLRRLVEESRADVVVLDTLYCFAPGANHSGGEEMAPLFQSLSADAKQTGAAYISLDHVSKGEASGEYGGPVSHSAVGSVFKGGACNVIAKLSRTGPAWALNVESHFGSWDKPLHYTRPDLDGKPGAGAIATTATKARGVSIERVCELFAEHGERSDEIPQPHFSSRRSLESALIKAGWTTNKGEAGALADSISREHAADANAGDLRKAGKPILLHKGGKRNATLYVWRFREDLNVITDAEDDEPLGSGNDFRWSRPQ